MNNQILKGSIAEIIKTNGNNEITGRLLQNVLFSIINQLGTKSQYGGIATISTNPGNPDQNIFYLISDVGIYPNFSNIEVVKGEIATVHNYTGGWNKVTLIKNVEKDIIFGTYNTSVITVDNNIFFATEIYYSWQKQLGFIRNQSVSVTNDYDCIIAKRETSNMATLYSGSTLYPGVKWWLIELKNENECIIAVKGDNGKWSSPYPSLQSLIDGSVTDAKIEDNQIIQQNKLSKNYVFSNFINGVYTSSGTTVNVGDIVSLKYTSSTDAFTLKFPVFKNIPISINTYQGQFTPVIIVDSNNKCLEVYGEKTNYLDNPLLITPQNDGYLIVNAHEVIISNRPKLKVSVGFDNLEERLKNVENEIIIPNVAIIEKTIKKGGTIGVDCDYTDIKVALNNITDNSNTKRYILNVLDGDYDYSNDGDLVGVKLKNYITLRGQSYNTRIIKRDSVFNWDKATIDKESGNLDYIALIGAFTIISNNCKCPVHIDSGSVKYGLFENLDLINEQPIGTGDNPAKGEANCFALGWRDSDHIILNNIRANGKLWGHNNSNTKSNAIFEFNSCNAPRIQIGDLTSYGNDMIIVKGCNVDVFELLWFSEFVGNRSYQRPSYSFKFIGNIINKAIIADHAGTHNALVDYYKNKYPFAISSIHKVMYGDNINIGDYVSYVDIDNVKKWEMGENLFGIAIENSDINNRVLIQYAGVVSLNVKAPCNIGDELNIADNTGVLAKRTTGSLVGYALTNITTGIQNIDVLLK